jgi:sodium transport system permease protein
MYERVRSARPFRAILAVARMELRASLRDRQTTLYTFVLPICMYPVLFWVMVQGALLVKGKREHTKVEVGIAAEAPDKLPSELAATLVGTPPDEEDPDALIPNAVVVRELEAQASRATARSWAESKWADRKAEGPDAVLFIADPDTLTSQSIDGTQGAELFFDSTKGTSEIARARVQARMPELVERLRAQKARDLGHDPRDLTAVEVESHDIAPRSDKGALLLSFVLPMLLVIMTVMGAFFPAVDLTAGEKERNTAETTMLLPVPRSSVHQGKILAVCTTAVIASSLNLIAIGLSAEHLFGMLVRASDVQIQLPTLALISIAPLALLFAFFVSAVLTGFAGLAATFKEGQAMLGPVQMVFILPALAGALPGLELTPGMAFVPVLNVILSFRAMLLGKAMFLEYGLTAFALLAYALIAIRLASHMLSRESVVLSGRSIPIKRLLSIFRSSGGTR